MVSIADFELFVKTIRPDGAETGTTIFLHDSLGCTVLWRDFPQKYMELTGHRVLIYDRRGYGKSTPYRNEVRDINYMEQEAEVLHELLSLMQIDHCTLFGHSDGATISLLTAAKYPGIIDQLIIEGPHIYVEEVTINGIRAALTAFQATDLRQRLQKYHGERTDEMVKAWVETWLSDDFRYWNITARLAVITCPVLILQGEQDEFGTAQQVWDIERHVLGPCEVYLIPETGHTPHKECPELVLARLRSLLIT